MANFEKYLNPDQILRELREKPAKYWADLVDEVFTDNAVVVIGKFGIFRRKCWVKN